MIPRQLYDLLYTVLEDLSSSPNENDLSFQKLQHIIPETMILAALDLIDRDCVIELKTSWGRSFYEVQGSTSAYSVYIGLPSHMQIYCSCPSFGFSVLSSEEFLMCKHVLAVEIARKIQKCVERLISEDAFSSIISALA